MKLKLRATNVFERNWNSKARITVNQGGSRSSKTYSLAQLFILRALQTPGVYTVVRKTLPALKATAYRDFLEVLKTNEIYREENHNRSELTYRIGGSEIEFISVDQPQKIRGRKRDVLWMNEANELSLEDFRQLILRTTGQVYMDFNPSDQFHWIYDHVLTRNDAILIKSTYKDNPFLDAETVKEIKRLKDTDENYWRIYGLGERATSTTAVYNHWQLIDELPKDGERIFGLDFGYNHPLALVEVVLFDDDIYARERIYQRALETPDAIKLIRDVVGKHIVYGDSEDPRYIKELNSAGIRVKPALKDKGSVEAGIREIKKRKFYITKDSVNLHKEAKTYSYKTDINGQPTEDVVKVNDDALDALRMAVYTYFQKPRPRFST